MYNNDNLYLPDQVLDFTENKRAIIVGGQGARPDSKKEIRRVFGFKDVEWQECEKSKMRPFEKAISAISSGKYDAVFILKKYSSHANLHVIRAAKQVGAHVINLWGGYGMNAISTAIEEQMINPRHGKKN